MQYVAPQHSQPAICFLYVDVNVKHKGQAKIRELVWIAFCVWLDPPGVGPRAA